MRALLLMLIPFVLTACDPGTPVGDLLHPRKQQDVNVSAVNHSGQAVQVTVGGSEEIDDDFCSPDYIGQTTTTVPDGSAQMVSVSTKCASGRYNWSIAVTNGTFSKTDYFCANHVTGTIVCDSATCTTSYTCDGGACATSCHD